MAIVVSEEKENLSQDLPPAYDDVANLSVQLEPVHETKKKSEVAWIGVFEKKNQTYIYINMKKRTIISRVITTCPSGLLSNILVMDKNQKFIAFLFHLPILLCTLVCQNIHHKLDII